MHMFKSIWGNVPILAHDTLSFTKLYKLGNALPLKMGGCLLLVVVTVDNGASYPWNEHLYTMKEAMRFLYIVM